MKKYLIETDVFSYFGDDLSPHYSNVIKRLMSLSPTDQVYISDLSLYEYYASLVCLGKQEQEKIIQNCDMLLQYMKILPLSPKKGGMIFSEIRNLYQQDTGISNKALKKNTIDFILASEAITNGLTLVYNDKIHERIAKLYNGLDLEKWTS